MTTQITPILLKQIRTELEAAMADIGKKHGLTLSIGKMAYNPEANNFRFQTDAVAIGGLTKEGVRLNTNAPYLDLPPNCAGKAITIGKHTGVLEGCNTTGTKVLVTHDSDGKTYLYETAKFAKYVIFSDGSKAESNVAKEV